MGRIEPQYELVIDILKRIGADGWVLPREVAEAAPLRIGVRTVRRYMARAAELGLIERRSKRGGYRVTASQYYWRHGERLH